MVNPHADDAPSSTGAMVGEVGFYGKLPSHGDFLARRVPDGFVGAWDSWLQECMAATRAALGDGWLDIYLTSPIWRFVCAAGACGPDAVAGVVVPSVDKVGRYFPLTIVVPLPPDTSPAAIAGPLNGFFDAAERLVVDTLAADRVQFEDFDAAVAELGTAARQLSEPHGVVLETGAAAMLTDTAAGPWCVPIGSTAELSSALEQIVAHRLSDLYAPMVLFWTAGSQLVQPTSLVTKGLPEPEQFVAFLDGAWEERRWNAVPAHVEVATASEQALAGDPMPPRYRSAAMTHRGNVRQVNQDAFLERSDIGLWVVADGVGGHQDGDVASRMICDALSEFAPGAGFEDMVDGARQRLHQVNEYLVEAGARPVNPVTCGSTVVALMARGTRCAVLWAGDSRVYRWRDGEMEQLTRDHSVAELEGGDSHAITRAVGGEATLALDLFRDRVRPGDRFLLCSDGLIRVLWESDIAEWLGADSIETAVNGLIEATLAGGAPDNVTVVVVEAYPEPLAGGPPPD